MGVKIEPLPPSTSPEFRLNVEASPKPGNGGGGGGGGGGRRKSMSLETAAAVHRKSLFANAMSKASSLLQEDEEEVEVKVFGDYISNNERKVGLLSFKSKMLDTLLSFEDDSALTKGGEMDMEKTRKTYAASLGNLAQSVDEWLMARFLTLAKELKASRPKRKTNLLIAMDNFHWVLLDSAKGHVSDEEIDQQLWERYAVNIENQDIEAIEMGDVDVFEVNEMKQRAGKFFTEHFNIALREATSTDLVEAVYNLVLYTSGASMLGYLFPALLEVFPSAELKSEIIPKLMMFCALCRSKIGADVLASVMIKANTHVTADAAVSALEYSCHLLHSNCGNVILNSCRHHLTPKALVCALLVAAARGNERMLSLLELLIVEKLTTDMNSDIPNFFTATNQFETYTDIMPLIYVVISLAVETSHSQNDTIPDLVQFYNQGVVIESLQRGGLTDKMHKQFITTAFDMACRFNHTTVLESLIEIDWVPIDINVSLIEAVQRGHQVIIHILLQSLLAPDSKMTFESGAIPVFFRKAKALTLLPMISRRFPNEVSWFLQQMSDVPVPSCVPPSSDQDPMVRSKLIKGIKLGSTRLSEIAKVTEHGVQTDNLWDQITFEGQLRRASAKTEASEYECDSIICMVPDILLTAPAIREAVETQDSSQTNSMIRLLSTGEEQIILSPAVQALMEYHWAFGHFWIRFWIQFFTMTIFIITNALLYFTVVVRGQGTPADGNPSIMSFGTIALCMSVVFLAQEFRQFLDDANDYVRSPTNMLDLFIHLTSIFLIIGDAWIGVSVDPLIMALVILLASYRMLLYLRIFPSVGPMVRITSSALLNVIPIIVPMGILMFAYAAAFYIIHQGLFGATTNYTSFWVSLQYTFTMFTFDYTVLLHPNVFEVFLCRVMFHATFLICFINLIVALMTVNVADITSNLRNSWLTEVSFLMVELEIYWPYPFKYAKWEAPSHRKTSNISLNHEEEEYEKIGIVLYTVPKARVLKSTWWTDFPKANTDPNLTEQIKSAPSSNRPKENTLALPNILNKLKNGLDTPNKLSSNTGGAKNFTHLVNEVMSGQIQSVLKVGEKESFKKNINIGEIGRKGSLFAPSIQVEEDSGVGSAGLLVEPPKVRRTVMRRMEEPIEGNRRSSFTRVLPPDANVHDSNDVMRGYSNDRKQSIHSDFGGMRQSVAQQEDFESMVKFDLKKSREVLGKVELLLEEQKKYADGDVMHKLVDMINNLTKEVADLKARVN